MTDISLPINISEIRFEASKEVITHIIKLLMFGVNVIKEVSSYTPCELEKNSNTHDESSINTETKDRPVNRYLYQSRNRLTMDQDIKIFREYFKKFLKSDILINFLEKEYSLIDYSHENMELLKQKISNDLDPSNPIMKNFYNECFNILKKKLSVLKR